MAEEETTEGGDEGEVAVRGKSPMLLIIIIAIVVLGGGGAAAYLMLGSSGEEGDEEGVGGGEGGGGEGGGEQVGGGASGQFGPIVEMPTIITNLSDPQMGRYIKVSIRLEVVNERVLPRVEGAMVPIRDRIITHFAGMTVVDAKGGEARAAISNELRRIINRLLRRDLVRNVYFAEFVVQ